MRVGKQTCESPGKSAQGAPPIIEPDAPKDNHHMNPANPFTRLLGSRLNQTDAARTGVDTFIRYWDAYESLVIFIFKSGEADKETQSEFKSVSAWLSDNYHLFESKLAPHWAGSTAAIGGQTVDADPFRSLIEGKHAHMFVGDWAAMQTLPTAREALNRWLIALAADAP